MLSATMAVICTHKLTNLQLFEGAMWLWWKQTVTNLRE